jgi:hypothetical protein
MIYLRKAMVDHDAQGEDVTPLVSDILKRCGIKATTQNVRDFARSIREENRPYLTYEEVRGHYKSHFGEELSAAPQELYNLLMEYLRIVGVTTPQRR